MIRKPLLLQLYNAASMQRWNDLIRPVELTELDKQAHKMVIAYVLAKCEEENQNKEFDWLQIIEAGTFEFLQRNVLTDLKPPLFSRIKEDRQKYVKLNEWVYDKISPVISTLGQEFCNRFRSYLADTTRNINRQIISAAHFYATRWEFDIIERANPRGYGLEEIKKDLESKQERYNGLKGMQKLLSPGPLKDFVDICGQLRFQIRWSHLHRVPKTSVLGHMLIVAMFAYLFSLQIKAEANRCRSNYFTGLFHDLPEVLTRDIINPIKRSVEGIREMIQEYEREEMEKKIYKLIPSGWHSEMKMYTENEFSDIVDKTGAITRDGQLLKGVDDLAAFIEVHLALKNGIKSEALENARYSLVETYRSKTISNINFGQIYADFV